MAGCNCRHRDADGRWLLDGNFEQLERHHSHHLARHAVDPALDPTHGVAVPFTADGGAFVVTDGPPPADVSKARAVARFHQLRDATKQPTVIAAVSGLVTVRAGLSPDPIVGRPAWIIVYTQGGAIASCPAEMTTPVVPPDASHMQSVVIMGEHPLPNGSGRPIDPILGYDGAGIGPCEPNAVPSILFEDQLNHGAG